jgi:hypothetical protein
MSTINKVPTSKQIIAGVKAIGSMKQYQHTWITGANLVELVVHHFLQDYEITVNKFNNAIHRHAKLKLALSIRTKNPIGIFSDRYIPTSSSRVTCYYMMKKNVSTHADTGGKEWFKYLQYLPPLSASTRNQQKRQKEDSDNVESQGAEESHPRKRQALSADKSDIVEPSGALKQA